MLQWCITGCYSGFSVHKYLLAQCCTITELLSVDSPNGLNKETATQLISIIGKLYLRAAKHIEHETENLVPLVAKNVTLRFLTGRNVATFKEMLKREPVENKSVESISTDVKVDLSTFKLEVAKILKK